MRSDTSTYDPRLLCGHAAASAAARADAKRARERLIGSAEHYAQALKAFASQVRSRMWIEQGRLSHKRWLRVTSRRAQLHEGRLLRVNRVTLTVRRSLPVCTQSADILRVSRHVSNVPRTEVIPISRWRPVGGTMLGANIRRGFSSC
jgi:hypothetical protein